MRLSLPLPIAPRVRSGGPRMIPGWLPEGAVAYLAHTAAGLPIRAVARARGCHASTVLRQIRRIEAWRDDPLIDEALERIAREHAADLSALAVSKELPSMPNPAVQPADASDPRIDREARRILRRLCEKGAFLAVAPSMEKAVVLREVVPGKTNRIAVVDRDVAHAFALQEWITCSKAGKIACYAISPVGRAALKRLLTEERVGRAPRGGIGGFEEAQAPFQEQHRFFAERTVMAEDGSGERQLRFNLAESPLSVLGRKRDKGGRGLSRAGADRGGRAAARGLRAGADRARGSRRTGSGS